MEIVYVLVGYGFIGLVVYLIVTRRLNRWHTISEYERGIIYRNGQAFQEVGPGTYKLRKERDFLVFVDVRPEAFDWDQSAVSTLDGHTAVYSLAGKTQIQDVRKAIYCARNCHQAALAKTIATVRRMLNEYEAGDIRNHTEPLCDNIRQRVRDAVVELGMVVTDLRLDQLRIIESVRR